MVTFLFQKNSSPPTATPKTDVKIESTNTLSEVNNVEGIVNIDWILPLNYMSLNLKVINNQSLLLKSVASNARYLEHCKVPFV